MNHRNRPGDDKRQFYPPVARSHNRVGECICGGQFEMAGEAPDVIVTARRYLEIDRSNTRARRHLFSYYFRYGGAAWPQEQISKIPPKDSLPNDRLAPTHTVSSTHLTPHRTRISSPTIAVSAARPHSGTCSTTCQRPVPRAATNAGRVSDRRSCAASTRSAACRAPRRGRVSRGRGARSRSHRWSRARWRDARDPDATTAAGT